MGPRSCLCSQASPLSKKPGRSFVPFFPASAIQLSKARFSQERIVRSTSAHHFLSFQPPVWFSAHSTPLNHLAISHSITKLSLTHPIHRANNIICATPLPACRNIGVRGCCRNNWLARNPAKPTSLQTISQSPSPSARDILKHTHSKRLTDRQLNSTVSTFLLCNKAISFTFRPHLTQIGASRSDDSRTTRLGKVLSSGVVSRKNNSSWPHPR